MTDNCKHEVTTTEKYTTVCFQCGEILEDDRPYNPYYRGVISVKEKIENPFEKLPDNILTTENSKRKYLELYDYVRNYTNSPRKKSVQFACAYYTHVLCGKPICYVRLVHLMEIPYSKANRGMVFLAECVTKGSEFDISKIDERTN